ncbi:PHD finger protein 11-like isoform X1 [Mastacembelus armatus]|uniref:PHD finger protein 11-like isoform X1 n=1 Tax=Mastacembelus armatus TaxID=205130 RepID=UPI000E4628E2|nr:PHD finger protein 11 isoform X1 [Mastacembelus armatus]
MDRDAKVSCILCKRCEETEKTGALSTKNEVTAHQNCLLFASKLWCRESPQFDDLFGFSVDDVLEEVNRGKKLSCNRCKQKGATAGCEVGRCKKSYHYPCAVEEGAKIIEDSINGKYGLYCTRHHQNHQSGLNSLDGDRPNFAEPKPFENSSGSSEEGSCPACEKKEESIHLERSPANTVHKLYCDKHAPSPYKNVMLTPFKRRLSNKDEEAENPPKRKGEARKNRVLDDSSSSDENEVNAEMAMFAPLESDLDESATSVSEHQFNAKETKNPKGSTSGNELEDEKKEEETRSKDEDETNIHSDTVSESLLCPVKICKETQTLFIKTEDEVKCSSQKPVQSPDHHNSGQSVPRKSSKETPPSPYHTKPPSVTSLMTSETLGPSSLSAKALPFKPKPNIDAASFWKSCNTAGCTQTIFTDFVNEISDISSRIQSDKASQQDYDLALEVMAASGKLGELMARHQEELKRKQMELTKAVDVMAEVISALKK